GTADRHHHLTTQGGRVHPLPAAGPASSDYSLLHVQDHGRLLADHAAGRLGWIVSDLQGAHRANPSAALADVLQLPAALYRDIDRLVHGRGGPPALDGLRRFTDRRRDDAVPESRHGIDLAGRLLRCLQLHFRFRNVLYPQAAARWAGGTLGSAPSWRRSQPTDVGRQ